MITQMRRLTAAALLSASCMSVSAGAQTVGGISSGNAIVVVNSSSPSTVVRTTQITGLGAGQTILAFDGRPAAGGRILYGLSNTGQLYAINAGTGVASAVGAPIAIQGTAVGLDFNPTVDRIRIVTNTGQNLRVNPDTGAVVTDGRLNIMVGGQPIPVNGNTAAAYTNNFGGATSTTLYVINTQTGLLQIQAPPNDGTLQAVGGLGGAAAGNVSGFDISIVGENRVSVIQNGITNLYAVNLQTGAATLIGQFGTGMLQGLAYMPIAFAAGAGLTPNQTGVAGALDNFTSVSPGFVGLLTTLEGLNQAGRADAFTQLGASSFGILPEAVLETGDMVDTTLRSYLQDFRDNGTPRGRAMIDDERAIGGFLVGTRRDGEFRARGDRQAVDYSTLGIMGVVDIRLSPTTLFGAAAGYEDAEIGLNSITPDSQARTVFGGLYGMIGFGPAHLDLVGSYGKTDLDLRRNVAFGNFATSSAPQTDARYYALSATAGLDANLGMLTVEPYVGVRYSDVKIDAFSEGAGLTALNVGQQDVESLQSIAGLRLAAQHRSGNTVFRPSLRAEYRHEFRNDGPRLITASFSGAGINTPFTTTTTPLGDDHLAIGAGLTVAEDGPLGFSVDYTGKIMGGYDIHGVQVALRFRL